MASTSAHDPTGRKTRLQVTTEKRKASEQLKEQEELKRQKEMFAPRKVIGPRDILVNSKIPKIKLEDDAGCSSSVKQENLEIESTNVGELSEIDEFIQPWTLDFDQKNVDQNGISIAKDTSDSSSENISELECHELSTNHITLLKALDVQKDEEINLLHKMIRGLKCHPCNDKKQIGLDEPGKNSSFNTQLLSQITTDLKEKDVKIKMLSMEMLKLQTDIFGSKNNSSQYITNVLEGSFEMILPYLYPELQLNDLLNCRLVCRAWLNATETFLNTHPSLLPFNKDIHTEEQRKLKLGRIPTWKKSPIDKLVKCYKFSDSRAFDIFTKNTSFKIVGSRIFLDNIIVEDPRHSFYLNINFLERFLTTFGVNIKYLKIRQNVELSDFKINLIMDRVKLCLGELSNLKGFNVVLRIDANKIKRKSGWNALKRRGNAEYKESWQPNNFPTLKSLESLKIEIDITDGWIADASFLQKFSTSLIQPYANQLKQLSIFAHGIGPKYSLEVPNLVELTIPRKFVGHWAKFDCKLVEKCTIITSSPYVLRPNDIANFQRLFPKLICLGIKLEYAGRIINEGDRNLFGAKLHGVVTLELENCGGVAFSILCCFPNLNYLSLINRYTNRIDDLTDEETDTVLDIRQLWEGESLYKSKSFWEHFPNISLVTLEFSGVHVENTVLMEPKIYAWTRTGYTNYWCDKINE